MTTGRRQLPFWPLGWMLFGLPLWWALGAIQLAPIALATVMAAFLLVHRRVRLPVPIALFFLFVCWVVPCALMIDSSDRLIGYALRFAVLLVVAVVMLYVYNAPELVTTNRVIGALVSVWLCVLAGGYLALVAPAGGFTTAVGSLLPARLASNDYVHDLFVPTFAEIQHPWGSPTEFARPAAPFPYTNSWGAAVVLLTPVVIAALFAVGRRQRILLLCALAAMTAPAAATSNRGMFVGLAAAAAYVCGRLVFRGRVGPAVAVLLAGGVGAGLLIAAGLPGQVAERQEYGRSTDTRSALYAETWQRSLDSPVFGYGAPRPSISNGISAGTQGYLWMVMFSYGLIGLLLLVVFLLSALTSTWRAPDPTSLCLHAVLISACVIVPYYGLDIMQWLTIGIVTAVLLRRSEVAGRRAR
ncbi:hypothetical protein OG394_09220 [Kribbella sp. NBC_01245]|uniref:hypothetical protein n=1 Tax=Kribbella sp. NBC_01245 TaxID=2903578 RepID=UPI002E2C5254|nr:hypothetical protein [Kribbella sp. NBC_01245]